MARLPDDLLDGWALLRAAPDFVRIVGAIQTDICDRMTARLRLQPTLRGGADTDDYLRGVLQGALWMTTDPDQQFALLTEERRLEAEQATAPRLDPTPWQRERTDGG